MFLHLPAHTTHHAHNPPPPHAFWREGGCLGSLNFWQLLAQPPRVCDAWYFFVHNLVFPIPNPSLPFFHSGGPKDATALPQSM